MHYAGERCQRTGLHFYQHLHHSCHPVRQLMGCRCHTEKGEDADTHNNCLRLCRQRPLQPAHRLLPVRHAKCVNIYLCTLFALEVLATKLRKNRNKHYMQGPTGTHYLTLILDVQIFGSVFLWSNFWDQCNLRCYWQSQMLHCKIRITLASEVFHKKILCFAKASEVFEGIVIFLLNVPHVFWYFQTKKEKVIETVCLTSPCYNQLCRIISSIKMDCVCNMCSKRFPNQE